MGMEYITKIVLLEGEGEKKGRRTAAALTTAKSFFH